MIGKILSTLVIVATAALLITIGFQVYSLVTVEQTGPEAQVQVESVAASSAAVTPVQAAAGTVPSATEAVADGAETAVDGEKPVAVKAEVPAAAPAAPAAPGAAPKGGQPAAASSEGEKREAIGKVDYISGKVTVIGPDGDAKTLSIGAEVCLNDRVFCGKEGKAKIALKDGTVLWVGETSELVLDKYVFSPGDRSKAECVLRFIKGACHIVTGAITSLNPDGFKLRARMATVGIRGCEVGVRGTDTKQDIMVLELGAKETVVVEAAEDGSAIMDPETGAAITAGVGPLKTLNISEAGVAVSVAAGKGVEMRKMESNEVRTFMRDTSSLAPAQYDLQQRPDGAVVVVQPGAEESPETQE